MYGRLHHPGTTSEMGIILKAVAYLIDRAPELHASFIEYHDGKWTDLAKDAAIEGKLPKSYQKTQINSTDDIQRYLICGLSKRKTTSTNQNTHSSRSNAVLILSNGNSKILFVDLAGNENVEGKENIRETCSINKSLAQLNTVLAYKAKRMKPPYRDNDFTYFLMPFLSKNKAAVFFHVRNGNIAKDLLKIEDIVGIKPTKSNARKNNMRP